MKYVEDIRNPPRLTPSPMIPAALLSQATITAPYQPLTEFESNVLSDLFPTLRDVCLAARSEQGRRILREYLDSQTVDNIVAFWG